MGEIADYIIDDMMFDEEYNEDVYYGNYEHLNYPRPINYKRCNRCGKSGLVWGNTDKGWRLFDKGIQHKCEDKNK